MATSTIDPRLPKLPVSGVKYEEDEFFRTTDEDSTEAIEGSLDVTYEYEDVSQEVTIQPPSNITVVTQTVKIVPGGATTVDVLLEIEDVPGAVEYERRESVA